MDPKKVIEATRRWVSSVVIGLNLCPFARRVFAADQIRYVVSDAEDEGGLLKDLAGEVRTLASSPISAVETTLLIHPHVLGAFFDYNEYLGAAERLYRGTRAARQHPARQLSPRLPVRRRRPRRGGELHQPVSLPNAAFAPRGECLSGRRRSGRVARNPAAQPRNPAGVGPGEDSGEAQGNRKRPRATGVTDGKSRARSSQAVQLLAAA